MCFSISVDVATHFKGTVEEFRQVGYSVLRVEVDGDWCLGRVYHELTSMSDHGPRSDCTLSPLLPRSST